MDLLWDTPHDQSGAPGVLTGFMAHCARWVGMEVWPLPPHPVRHQRAWSDASLALMCPKKGVSVVGPVCPACTQVYL